MTRLAVLTSYLVVHRKVVFGSIPSRRLQHDLNLHSLTVYFPNTITLKTLRSEFTYLTTVVSDKVIGLVLAQRDQRPAFEHMSKDHQRLLTTLLQNL